MTNPFYLITIHLDDTELIPYVRMTRRSMFSNKYAKLYLLQQKELREIIRLDLSDQNLPQYTGDYYIPDKTPFILRLSIATAKRMHRCDLDNQVKACLDLCQGVVFSNDSWCDVIHAGRYPIGEGEKPFVRIIFTQLRERGGL